LTINFNKKLSQSKADNIKFWCYLFQIIFNKTIKNNIKVNLALKVASNQSKLSFLSVVSVESTAISITTIETTIVTSITAKTITITISVRRLSLSGPLAQVVSTISSIGGVSVRGITVGSGVSVGGISKTVS
jgi:hypothetical protein